MLNYVPNKSAKYVVNNYKTASSDKLYKIWEDIIMSDEKNRFREAVEGLKRNLS